MLQYVLTSDTLCIFDGPNNVEIGRDHHNFTKIANLLADENCEFEQIKELACIVSSISSVSDGKIEVTDMGVFYNGALVHNSVVDAIFDYQKMGVPIGPIIKFLENLMQNPSKNSIDQLWRFIEHHKLPLTEDGHLLAYKAVRNNYMDKYSGAISNAVGQVIKMERNKISDDANHHCATGLHVGGLAYSGPEGWYSSNGDICVIVKVNPKNVVCVPHDHNSTKIRVCEYEVVKNYCAVLKNTTYNYDYEEVECDEYCECDDSWLDERDIDVGDIVTYGDHDFTWEILLTESNDTAIIRNLVTRQIVTADISELELIND